MAKHGRAFLFATIEISKILIPLSIVAFSMVWGVEFASKTYPGIVLAIISLGVVLLFFATIIVVVNYSRLMLRI